MAITENSPALGTFVLKDFANDELSVDRTGKTFLFRAQVNSVGHSSASVEVATEADSVELIKFLAYSLDKQAKTKLAMDLLQDVSFADVLAHLGVEVPK